MAEAVGLGRKILIVEDDENFRQALRILLSSKKYEVFEAENGKVAQDMIFKTKVDVILSDIRMPHMQGTDLLKFVRCTSQIPFILMTGFSDIMEVESAYKLGASGFVTKPFKPQELLEIINKCFIKIGDLSTSSVEENKSNHLDFCAVSIDDFLGSPHLKMDIYIRLTSEKFVKVAHKGTPVSPDQIRGYKNKGVNFLYIKADEFSEYVNFNLKLIDQVSKNKSYSVPLKVKVVKHAQEVLVQNVFVGGIDKARIEESSAIIKSTLSVLSQDHQIFELVDAINGFTDHLYAHSLGVSAYSVLIAQAMGWHSAPVLFKLSMAGLLHDIGKKEISREILDKSRFQLNDSEITILESHAFRGKEILANIPSVPGDVVQIVLQHHENNYGRGPLRIKGVQMHPLAKVVALANHFVELVVRNPSYTMLEPLAAYEKILEDSKSEFDPLCLEGLAKVVEYKNKTKKTG